jgi:hypothetical protein
MAVSLHDGKRPATGMGMGTTMGNSQQLEQYETGQPLERDETGHGKRETAGNWDGVKLDRDLETGWEWPEWSSSKMKD